jgi:hypothetical protein
VTEIAASPLYMDVRIAPGVEWRQPVPAGHTTLAYIFEGSGQFGAESVEAVRMILFSDGDHVQVVTQETPVRFMLIAGAPFGEPIVPYGPFVMNTEQEIYEAIADLRRGTFVR